VFDGVRGVATVLVVISHGWTLWPTDEINAHQGLRQLFASGDAAVSVFFVIGAFLTTSGLLGLADSHRLRPLVAVTRRWVRLSAQTYLLLAVVLVVLIVEPSSTYPDTDTGASVLHVATYTWNWFLHSHPVQARPDLGHLWYLSVDFQVFLMTLVLVYAFRGRRLALVVTLGGLLLLCLWWRAHMYDVDPLGVTLRTWTRADSPLVGALAAAALPWLRRLTPWAWLLSVGGVVLLVPSFWFAADVSAYFGWAGFAVDLAAAAVVVGCSLAEPPRLLSRSLGSAPLTFVGRQSLGIYLWHYPVFWFLARHTFDWSWPSKTLLAAGIIGVAVYLGHRFSDVPAQRLLAQDWWRSMEGGRRRATTPTVTSGDAAGRSESAER